MFEQAAGLALAAAFYPPAMLIAAMYLASKRPGRVTTLYVLGGLVIVTLVGAVVLIAIRAGGLSLDSQSHTRYGLRLGLGIVAIVASVVIARRRPGEQRKRVGTRPGRKVSAKGDSSGADQGTGVSAKPKKPGIVQRLTADPSPRTAFLVGIFMFGPSLTFVAAVQAVATSKASLDATIGAMVMIFILTLSFAWIPLLAFLIAPDATARRLKAFENWLSAHRKVVLSVAVGVVGVFLVIQGISGLA